MEEVGFARLTSLDRVTTGVGSVSRATHIELRSGLTWQGAATYVTWRYSFLGFVPESHYLLDAESTQSATEIITLPQVKYEKILRPKRGKN